MLHRICVVLASAIPAVAHAQAPAVPLITDAALSGWHVVVEGEGRVSNDAQDVFAFEDGVLSALYNADPAAPQPFAALITDSVYVGDYDLHLEYRWGEDTFAPRDTLVRDAGVLVHVHNQEEFWAGGIECQIQEGDTGDAWLIGTRAKANVNVDAQNFNPTDGVEERRGVADRWYARVPRWYSWEVPGWNALRIEVRGRAVRFFVNDHLVNAVYDAEYHLPGSDAWAPLSEGRILLQAEGAEVQYRGVGVVRR